MWRPRWLAAGAFLFWAGCSGPADGDAPGAATLAPVGAAMPIDALRVVCATSPACASSWVVLWRGPDGHVGALALDNRGCGFHMPTVWFDGAGQRTFVAAMFPYMPGAPANDPSRMRAEAQQARMAELTRGLVQAEEVRCSPLGEVIRMGPPVPAPSPPPSPAPPPTGSMQTTTAPAASAAGASLACELRVYGERFEIVYGVREEAGRPAWVLDTLSDHAQPATRRSDPLYLAWNGGERAHIVQGIAPLPPDRMVGVRVIPLGERLAPRSTLQRTLSVPRPLRETGPYDPAAGAEAAPGASVTNLVLDVHLVREEVRDFSTHPWPTLPGSAVVRSHHTVGDAHRVSCELAIPATPLHLQRARGFTRVQ